MSRYTTASDRPKWWCQMPHSAFISCWMCLLVLAGGHVKGLSQGLTRTSINSMGGTYTATSGVQLRVSVGQPPNAGTLTATEGYLRQGFQQPSSCALAPQAVFSIVEEGPAACGGPYRFVYEDEAEPETIFSWDFGWGSVPDISSEESPGGVTYLVTGEKEIRLQVTTGDCSSELIKSLEVNQIPITSVANTSDLLCREDQDGAINLFVQGGTEPYNVSWADGQNGTVVSGLMAGQYPYTLTDALNCLVLDTAIVNAPDSLTVELFVGNESCLNSLDGTIETLVQGGTEPYLYRWTDGERDDPFRASLESGDYHITILDANNCRVSLTAEVERNCDLLEFTEVITPNGDGQNEVWIVDDLLENFPDHELEIYDRWGRVVYSAVGYTNNWDGRDERGTPLPIGTYFFVIDLKDSAGTQFSGAITLLR